MIQKKLACPTGRPFLFIGSLNEGKNVLWRRIMSLVKFITCGGNHIISPLPRLRESIVHTTFLMVLSVHSPDKL